MYGNVGGFVKLSELLGERGPAGSEELAFHLHKFMEKIGIYFNFNSKFY